jgi:uncharacterized surface protein with fasciclin (FAS1) repeats
VNTNALRRIAVAVAAVAVLPLSMTACSGDDSSSSADSEPSASANDDSKSGDSDAKKNEAMDGPFGSACSAVPKTGDGSFKGMAEDPVATAASNNPALSTLVTAVKKAGLVDTLNNAENITVFAPTNDAFKKIPEDQLNAVLNDKKKLTDILTYHVVGQKVTPKDLENGEFKTLEGGTVTTSGTGTSFKVNDTANVVCGNVPTKNATVYIIDSVLMPKK